jgi:hypothetical protein
VIVFVPPLPTNPQDFRYLITAAVALVDRVMLTRVLNGTDYPIIFCRITKGGYIEHLQKIFKENLESCFLYWRKKYRKDYISKKSDSKIEN